MSERRRASARKHPTPSAPPDQKVWGPQDSGSYGSGAASPEASDAPPTGGRAYGGSREGRSAHYGHPDAPASAGRGRRARRDDLSRGDSYGGSYGDSYGDTSYGGSYETSQEYGSPRGRRRAGRSAGGESGAYGSAGVYGDSGAYADSAAYADPGAYADSAAYADSGAYADTGAYEPADDDGFPEEEKPRRRRRGRRGDEEETGGFRATADDSHGQADTEPRRRGGRGAGGGDDAGDGRDGGDGGDGGGQRGRGVPGVWGWISIVLTSVLVIGTLTAYKTYRSTFDLINRVKPTDELDQNRPENQTGAINVLLVGSDTRTGDNKKYGQYMENDGERTDTIMLLHVSPNRDGATLLSFPRDSMVMISACKHLQTGAIIEQHLGMINAAFSDGGMRCTRRTIEDLTGIRIDHFVKVDFTGFKNIVNALGGIEICLPHAVNDKKSKLDLPAGRQLVRGEAALGYVRLRNIGDGSDIGRIKRQQVFISQVVKKATSRALLTDMSKLRAFIEATAESVTMDDDLSAETLIQIAQSASKLTAKGFKATTVPWEPYVGDKNRVQWKQPDANNLFNAIRSDTEVTPTASPSAAASPGATPSKPAVTKPSQVKVQVFNGTNTDGKAREVAEALSAQGFNVTGIGGALRPDGTEQPKTMIRYTGQGWDYAKILAGKLLSEVAPETGKVAAGVVTPFTPSSASPDTPKGRVSGPVLQLVIGADWEGVKVPLEVGDNAVTAETNICAS